MSWRGLGLINSRAVSRESQRFRRASFNCTIFVRVRFIATRICYFGFWSMLWVDSNRKLCCQVAIMLSIYKRNKTACEVFISTFRWTEAVALIKVYTGKIMTDISALYGGLLTRVGEILRWISLFASLFTLDLRIIFLRTHSIQTAHYYYYYYYYYY